MNLADVRVEDEAELASPPAEVPRSQDFDFCRVIVIGEVFEQQVFEESGQQELLLEDPVHAGVVEDLGQNDPNVFVWQRPIQMLISAIHFDVKLWKWLRRKNYMWESLL